MPQKLRKSEFPNDIQAQLIRMWDYADRISKSPSAYDARTESGSESGYLFAQKVRMAEQQQYILFSGLKRHLNEKGEAYLVQAKQTYSVGGWQRDFVLPGEEQEIISLNKKVHDQETDQVVILHDISQLARHKVTIAESPTGLTNRLISRAVSAEVMATIPPENIGTRTVLTGTIVNSVDSFSADDKEKLKTFRKLEEEQAKMTLEFGIENLKLQKLNVQEQIKVLEARKQQQPAQIAAGTPTGEEPGPGPAGMAARPALGGQVAQEAQGGQQIAAAEEQAPATLREEFNAENPDLAPGAPAPLM